jgi:23S rRNA (cytosine1962-C5)-methyltransferase
LVPLRDAGLPLPVITLRKGRERPFLGRHPWVFSGAVGNVRGEPEDGDEVLVEAAGGKFVARGLWNSRSQIRVRLYTWIRDEPLARDFWRRRLRSALRLRDQLPGLDPASGPVRLVFSEGDGISGMVVDRYGDRLVVQLTSLALARRMDLLLDLLEEELSPAGIYLRTERGIGEEEGLALEDGVLRGKPPPEEIEVEEGGMRFAVDLRTGQKTGYYMDQRENRARVAAYAEGREAADLFCYSGGFALALAGGGARRVIGVDSSTPALALARENARRNALEGDRVRFEEGDAFKWLEAREAAGDTFGLIVLDPPRFARSRRGVPSALRGYEQLNELAVRLLEPSGILATFSCSGRVSRDEFQGVLQAVAERTGRPIQILETLGQPGDHPVSVSCPETAYLKGFICRVE